jgi:glycosidase
MNLRSLPASLALALSITPALAAEAAKPARPARAGARLEVLKVEPPSWWAGHSINPVRLLVRGRGLAGASVEAPAGLTISGVKVNAAGTYLFADLSIDPAAAPGPRSLRIAGPGGSAEARFELLSPLPREGRFQGFSPDDVIYLIMPDRFDDGDPRNDDPAKARGVFDRKKARSYHGGDLQGVIDRLPYLADLGVTALWLNPWYDNTDRPNEKEAPDGVPSTGYHGYHAEDFYAVDEHLGDLGKLRELVDAAHARGLKVIQDQVANHTGPYHVWLEDPPTPTWFSGTLKKHVANTWQTWTLADPNSGEEVRRDTLGGWFVDILPDLDQDDPEVARYTIQNTLWWVGVSGLDGIRQDTLPYVPRRFWREWMAAIKKEYPDLRVVGELFDGDPALVSFYQGGVTRYDGIDSGVDTLFDFPTYFKLRDAFAQGKTLREVPMMLSRDHLYRDPAQLVTFLGLHDVKRFMNEPGATAAGLKLAFTFLMTSRGIPLVYYGDEIALPGGDDPDNRREFPGGFPGDPRSAFDAAGRSPQEQAVFDHVRKAIHLRRELAALRQGRQLNLFAGEQLWAYARVHPTGSALVVLNNAAEPATVDLAVGEAGIAEGATLVDRLGFAPAVRVEKGRVRVSLEGRAGAVFAVK